MRILRRAEFPRRRGICSFGDRLLPDAPGLRYSLPMHADANTEGFRILRSNSALLLLELLWRWSFGVALLALLYFAYAHLRQAVPLSNAEASALDSQDPIAMAEAAMGMIARSRPLLLGMLVQLSAMAAVLWVIAAALGRGVLGRILVRRFAADYALSIAPHAPRWRSIAVFKMARVLALLILLLGYLAAEWIAARVAAPGQSVLTPVLILIAALAVAGVLWSYVNWVLSLAPVFVVRDGLGPLSSVAAAVGFVRRNHSHLAAIASWNGTLRGLAATVITLAGVATVELRTSLPGWSVSVLYALETLAYLVVSDFFLLARFAAYCSVALRELKLSQALAEAAGAASEGCGTPAA